MNFLSLFVKMHVFKLNSQKKKMRALFVVALWALAAAQNCRVVNDLGCYVDKITPVMAAQVTVTGPLTLELCAGGCASKGFSVAGVENGQFCFCDNKAKGTKASAGDCDDLCPGDPTEQCGGRLRLNEVCGFVCVFLVENNESTGFSGTATV